MNSTLSQNKTVVDAFVERRFPYVLNFIYLFANFDTPTGYEAYAPNERSQPVIRSTRGVTVLLRRSEQAKKGYYVVKAYPMNED